MGVAIMVARRAMLQTLRHDKQAWLQFAPVSMVAADQGRWQLLEGGHCTPAKEAGMVRDGERWGARG